MKYISSGQNSNCPRIIFFSFPFDHFLCNLQPILPQICPYASIMSSSIKGKQFAVPARRATAAYREYDHPERQSLINELLDNPNLHDNLHAETQAFLWLSDIQCLRGLVLGSRDHKMRGKSEIENGYNKNDDYGEKEDESDINEGEADCDNEGEGDNKDYRIANSSLSLDFQCGYRSAWVSENCKSVNC